MHAYRLKHALSVLALALLLIGRQANAKTFDIGSGTIELPEDFVEVYSAPHEPFSHGFSSRKRGLFIGWIITGRSDAPPEKRIERPISTDSGIVNELSYRLSISKIWDTRLVIVFPEPQRTSFWADIKSQKDLEYVKLLILTFKSTQHK